MPDYSNSKIYKIIDNTNGNMYVGSTTQSLAQRLAGHVRCYKGFLQGTQQFTSSFDIIKNSNYDIVLLEEINCETKEQLHARERFHIENNNCINLVIPTRTEKEYREAHKERRQETTKLYREKHKERLQEQKREYDKKYREENKELLKEKDRLKYEKNKERINTYKKEWYLRKKQKKENQQAP